MLQLLTALIQQQAQGDSQQQNLAAGLAALQMNAAVLAANQHSEVLAQYQLALNNLAKLAFFSGTGSGLLFRGKILVLRFIWEGYARIRFIITFSRTGSGYYTYLGGAWVPFEQSAIAHREMKSWFCGSK